MKPFLAFLVAVAATAPSGAQPLPWTDAFDDGDSDGWAVVQDRLGTEPVRSGPPRWVVEDGALRQTSNVWVGDPPREFELYLGTHVAAGDPAWADYSLNVTARSDDDDGLGVLVRYESPTRYVRFLLMQDPANGGPVRKLERRDGDVVTTLALDRPAVALPPDPFSITVDVRGDSVRAYVDGAEVFAVRDGGLWPSGRVGLGVYANAGAVFDDVAVTSGRVVRPRPPARPPVARLPYVQLPTPTSMTVAWQTPEPTRGVVEYGPTPALGSKVELDERARRHVARIDGLAPGATTYYRVTADDAPFGETAAFRTPVPGDSALTVLVFGDSGTGTPAQAEVRDAMLAAVLDGPGPPRADLGLHVGDVHQGRGDDYDAIYFGPYADLVARLPVMLSVGNHDTYHDDAATYLDDFYFPSNNPAGTERYYSFEYGAVHAVAVDSNLPLTPGTPQYEWLAADLAGPAAQAAQWRIVYFHHPPWCQAWSGWAGDLDVRRYLVPLFEAEGVDLVLNGHTHAYERGTRNGVTYLVTGGGGGSLDDYGRDVAHIDVTVLAHHYTLLDVEGPVLTVRAVTPSGVEIDRHRIDQRTATSTEDGPVSALEAVYPNPLERGAAGRVRLTLAAPAEVAVDVFDTLGRRVASVHRGPLGTGAHELRWTLPSDLAAGAYLVRVEAGDAVRSVPLTVAD